MRERVEPCVVMCRPGVPASEIIADLDQEGELGDYKVVQWGQDDAVLQLVPDMLEANYLAGLETCENLSVLFLDEDRVVYQYEDHGYRCIGKLQTRPPAPEVSASCVIRTNDTKYFIKEN